MAPLSLLFASVTFLTASVTFRLRARDLTLSRAAAGDSGRPARHLKAIGPA